MQRYKEFWNNVYLDVKKTNINKKCTLEGLIDYPNRTDKT